MLNVPRQSCVRIALFCLLLTLAGSTAQAQTSQNPGLDRQLSRIDLAVSGVGVFNKDSNGTAIVNGKPTEVNLSPGNTAGALVTARDIAKPFVGFEFNYGYARYVDTFTPFGAQATAGVQQNANEYTFGYVAHARKQ